MIPLRVDMKEMQKDYPFTIDADLPNRKTGFGIRGLNPKANVKTPINIEKVIAAAVNREFHLRRARLNEREVKKVTRVLAKTFNRKLKRTYAKNTSHTFKDSAYVGSDLDWLPDGEEKENLRIVQHLVLLLATAALRRSPVVFR